VARAPPGDLDRVIACRLRSVQADSLRCPQERVGLESGGRALSVVQTVLVFVAIPLGVSGVFMLLIFGRSGVRVSNRYRPGRPWNFEPVWYVPHPAATRPGGGARRAIGGPAPRAAIESGEAATPSAVGGASGEW
jgi:hypothetical protein